MKGVKKLEEKVKVKLIDKEFKKLKKIFGNLDDNKKDISAGLLEQAAFMKVTLSDLKDYIVINGVTEEYQNGKEQWGIKKSSQAEMYNTMIKNYSSVIKQLIELLPDEVKTSGSLLDYLENN